MDASMPLKRPTFNEEVSKMKKVVELKHEVLQLTKVCLRQLEERKKGLQHHFLGFKFNMEDQKLASMEAEKSIKQVEVALHTLLNQ